MSDTLVTFIHATMRKRLNDLESPHSLPKLLRQVRLDDGSPLLPVRATDWQLGTIGGEAGDTIAAATAEGWWSLVRLRYAKKAQPPFTVGDFSAIPLPDAPRPSLTLPEARLSGLENIQLGALDGVEPLDDGYRLTASLLFGRHSALPRTLTVSGRYLLRQAVCARKGAEVRPTSFRTTMPCVAWPQDEVNGTGNFSLTVSGLALRITLRIQLVGTGAQRGLRLVVEAVHPEGEDGHAGPSFALDREKLTVDGPKDPQCVKNTALEKVWLDNAVEVFGSPQAQTALAQQLDGTLNRADIRAQLSQAVTEQLGHVLDSALGAVPPGALAGGGSSGNNPVDQYLFDRLRTSVGNETSAFFPPTVLRSITSPSLEPFAMKEITVGDVDLGSAWGKAEAVTLGDVSVAGASNAVVPPENASLTQGVVRATVALSTLRGKPPVPDPPLRLTGTFRFRYGGTPSPEGKLTVEVHSSSLAAALAFAGADVDDLALTFTSLGIGFANKDLTLRVDLDGAEIESAVNEALTADSVKDAVRSGLNDALAKELTTISNGITPVVRQAIIERLDAPDAAGT